MLVFGARRFMQIAVRLARVGVWAVLLVSLPATGQPARDFAGTVVAVSGKRLTVENRMGDARSFAGGAKTPVSGTRSAWGEIRQGDHVVVSWSLDDRPAKARRIQVTGSR
jgi:hypothetical protein